jgi:hypothetical protein
VNTHCYWRITCACNRYCWFTINLFQYKLSPHTWHTTHILLREDNSLKFNSNRFWEVEPVEQSSTTPEQQAREATRSQGSSEFPRGEEHMLLLPHHPVFKETSSMARTRIAFGGGAKHSNGTQQHNWWVLPMDRLLYYIVMDTGSTNQTEDIWRLQSHHH